MGSPADLRRPQCRGSRMLRHLREPALRPGLCSQKVRHIVSLTTPPPPSSFSMPSFSKEFRNYEHSHLPVGKDGMLRGQSQKSVLRLLVACITTPDMQDALPPAAAWFIALCRHGVEARAYSDFISRPTDKHAAVAHYDRCFKHCAPLFSSTSASSLPVSYT